MNPAQAHTVDWPTDRGTVILRAFCAPEEIERLTYDLGAKDFARYRPLITGKESLIQAAHKEETNVTLALTGRGEIVGAGILEFPASNERWHRVGERAMMEVSVIEIDRAWRGAGMAEAILRLLLEHPRCEERIIYMVGYSWTWDMEGQGLSTMAYRDMLIRLFSRQGFRIFQTNEPNVMLRPENVFMARIGAYVSGDTRERFKKVRFDMDRYA